MNDFTEEEIIAAKETRDAIIKERIPELVSIYMAGEICMWDEIQNSKNQNTPDVGGSLHHKELIEKLITEEFYKTYGTNGNEEHRLEQIKGAKFIISWLVNNSH